MDDKEDAVCPHPQEFQAKMLSLGWDSRTWVPTPGVTDEATEFYVTLGNRHIHIISIAEAMALSDDELRTRIEQAAGMSKHDLCEQYGANSAEEWRERYGNLEQEVIL
jgi:hypothetical protein